MKLAVTEMLVAVMFTVHGPVPLQAPLHPVNTEPGAGMADSGSVLPLPNSPEHVFVQSDPSGTPATSTLPCPIVVTINVHVAETQGAREVWIRNTWPALVRNASRPGPHRTRLLGAPRTPGTLNEPTGANVC